MALSRDAQGEAAKKPRYPGPGTIALRPGDSVRWGSHDVRTTSTACGTPTPWPPLAAVQPAHLARADDCGVRRICRGVPLRQAVARRSCGGEGDRGGRWIVRNRGGWCG